MDRARYAICIVRVARAGLLAKLPKLETERVHPYYFFERGSRRTVGTQRVGLGRGRGQCSHRHFMKIAPPVPTASSVQAKYVTPISRLMVAILFRMHAPLNADRSRLPRSKLIILLYVAVDFLERACVLLLVCLRLCSSDKMVNVRLFHYLFREVRKCESERRCCTHVYSKILWICVIK